MDTIDYTSKFFKIDHKEVLELHAQKNTNKEISDRTNMTLYMVEKILNYYNLTPNKNIDKINHQVVIDLYNQCQKISEVASILNVEDYMVDKILMNNNVTKRKVKLSLNSSDVIRDYLECRDVFIVAEKYGTLSISPIVKILKDNNIKRKKHPIVREKKVIKYTINRVKIGDKFGMLTVIDVLDNKIDLKGKSVKMLLCKCDCGKELERSSFYLRNKPNNLKSCGCHIENRRREKEREKEEIRSINTLEYLKKKEEYRVLREIRDNERLVNAKIRESRLFKNKYKVGDKKDRFTITKIDDKDISVVCECGTEKVLNINSFKVTKSCGCLQRERSTVHGLAPKNDDYRRKWYDRHRSMVSRCYNPKVKPYHNYGGRGITVCDRWMEPNGVGCKNYIDDIHNILGPQPGPEYSLDRINNDGMYEITNLRWATNSEQSKNQRRFIK
jgi:hypothetical protein